MTSENVKISDNEMKEFQSYIDRNSFDKEILFNFFLKYFNIDLSMFDNKDDVKRKIKKSKIRSLILAAFHHQDNYKKETFSTIEYLDSVERAKMILELAIAQHHSNKKF